MNVIPTEATAHVDGRFLPGFEDEFFDTIAELCGEGIVDRLRLATSRPGRRRTTATSSTR